MTVAASKPRRRWFQFSLKGLMLLVVVAAIPCGWLKWKMDRKAKERAVVAELQGLGCEILYDWQYNFWQQEPPGPQWVRTLFGDDLCSTVIRFHSRQATDNELQWLPELPNLEGVIIDDRNGKRVTDVGLAHIGQLAELRNLAIFRARISDTGLRYLEGARRLRTLELNGCSELTDAGLVPLRVLIDLKALNVTGTKVTAAGIAELQKALPNCKIYR